jgi:hypothetical protein
MKDNVIPCVRKKPFKLADKTDLKIGMQVWLYNRYHENDAIYTGMVRFISSWGHVNIWKYPEDRDPKRFLNIAYENSYIARRDCFSTLKGAEEFREKEIKAREQLKAWMKKHKYPSIEET